MPNHTPQLTIVHESYLATPRELASPELQKLFKESEILMAMRVESDDVITGRWPMTQPHHVTNLRTLLYACRETGQLPKYTEKVLLPDGEEFNID